MIETIYSRKMEQKAKESKTKQSKAKQNKAKKMSNSLKQSH